VTVTAATGTVEVRATHSPIRIGKAGGGVTVFSSSGPVEITDAAGPVKVDSSGGPVSVQGIRGATEIRSTGGPVDLGGFGGGALSATHTISAGSGDVDIDWPAAAGVAWRLESFGGDVTVLRPGEGPLEGTTQGARVYLDGRWREGAARIEVSSRGADVALEIR